MYHWAHITRNKECHRQVLPGLFYGSQASQCKKLEEGGPALCESFSIKCGQGKQRQGQQQNMVDVSSTGLGNSKHTASPSYHAHGWNCPHDFLQLGSETHQAEQASLQLTVMHQLS
jgi:hypothetical protein